MEEDDGKEIPAFEIRNPETGHVYKIYASGWIEGFEGPRAIVNRIPRLIAEAVADGAAQASIPKTLRWCP